MVRTMLIATLIAGDHIDNDEESDGCWCMSSLLRDEDGMVADVGKHKYEACSAIDASIYANAVRGCAGGARTEIRDGGDGENGSVYDSKISPLRSSKRGPSSIAEWCSVRSGTVVSGRISSLCPRVTREGKNPENTVFKKKIREIRTSAAVADPVTPFTAKPRRSLTLTAVATKREPEEPGESAWNIYVKPTN